MSPPPPPSPFLYSSWCFIPLSLASVFYSYSVSSIFIWTLLQNFCLIPSNSFDFVSLTLVWGRRKIIIFSFGSIHFLSRRTSAKPYFNSTRFHFNTLGFLIFLTNYLWVSTVSMGFVKGRVRRINVLRRPWCHPGCPGLNYWIIVFGSSQKLLTISLIVSKFILRWNVNI